MLRCLYRSKQRVYSHWKLIILNSKGHQCSRSAESTTFLLLIISFKSNKKIAGCFCGEITNFQTFLNELRAVVCHGKRGMLAGGSWHMGRELPVIAIKGNGSKQSPIRSSERILMNVCKSNIVYVCTDRI